MGKSTPFISVVVCTHNGAEVLPDCLQALLSQQWEGKHEIIVVDDGSTDATQEVANSFGVRVIHVEQNVGPAAARNRGIQAAKGSIVAFTDDDCRPDSRWLKKLYAEYKDKTVVGVGGKTIPHSNQTFLSRYLHEQNPLQPLELEVAAKRSPFARLTGYLKAITGIGSKKQSWEEKRPVYALPSANLSVRTAALKKVGMFDASFDFSGEDQDLCRRINQQYPQGLRYTPQALVFHKYKNSLKDILRRSKAYGKGNALFRQKYPEVKPVIFPTPFAFSTAATCLTIYKPWLGLLSLGVIPLIFAKWLRLFFLGRLEALGYGYIQFLQELYGDIGYFQGVWYLGRKRVRQLLVRVSIMARHPYVLLLLLIIAFTCLEWLQSPLQAVVAASVSLVLPGYLTLKVCKVTLNSLSLFMYAVVLSVGELIGLALILNALVLIFPDTVIFGAPLFVGGLDVWLLCLVIALWRRVPHPAMWQVPRVSLPAAGWVLLLGLLPMAGVFGAKFLNSTGNNKLSLGVMAVIAICLAFLVFRYQKISFLRRTFLFYIAGLTIILLGSTRGYLVGGVDISKEFYLLQLVQQAGHWTPQLYQDAYNACLSITLLPTLLSHILKVSNQTVFQVVVPVLYAMVPVMAFTLYQRWKAGLVAILGGLFIIVQPAFVTWSPVPVRQMFGIFFFTALIMVAFETRLSKKVRAFLFFVFGLSMILSHYSTAYLSLGLFVTAYGIQILAYFRDRYIKKMKERFQPLISAPLILSLLVCAIIWYGPITHTSDNITTKASKAWQALVQGDGSFLHSDAYAEKTSLSYQLGLSDGTHSTQKLWNEYLQETNQKYKDLHITPLQDKQKTSEISPQTETSLPATHPVLAKIGQSSDQMLRRLVRLYLVIGLVVFLWFYIGARKMYAQQQFSLAAGLMLLLVIVVPHASIDYDVGRTTQHLLVLLVLPAIIGVALLLRVLSRATVTDRVIRLAVGSSLLLLLLFTSGFIPQLSGGSEPNILFNNQGNQYDQIYVHKSETLSAKWLKQQQQEPYLLYAGYFSGTRLFSANIERPMVYNDIFPWTIDKNAYIYSGYAETTTHQATTYYKGSFLHYSYPEQAIKSQKGVIYTNGTTAIYK